MSLSISKLNKYLMFKLPSAYLCGVRANELNAEKCVVSVRLKWINQNPFNSMFWAVQGMAAELTSGALVMDYILKSGENISMLVLNNKASFTKKAKGRITFTCHQGIEVRAAIDRAVTTKEGQTVWLDAIGMDENNDEVSRFSFEWTLKVKSK